MTQRADQRAKNPDKFKALAIAIENKHVRDEQQRLARNAQAKRVHLSLCWALSHKVNVQYLQLSRKADRKMKCVVLPSILLKELHKDFRSHIWAPRPVVRCRKAVEQYNWSQNMIVWWQDTWNNFLHDPSAHVQTPPQTADVLNVFAEERNRQGREAWGRSHGKTKWRSKSGTRSFGL